MAFKLGMTVDLCMAYNMLMLVLMTLTLMQGHSGSAEEQIQRATISTTKQVISINLATTVGYDFEHVYGLTMFFFFCSFCCCSPSCSCSWFFFFLLLLFLFFFLCFLYVQSFRDSMTPAVKPTLLRQMHMGSFTCAQI